MIEDIRNKMLEHEKELGEYATKDLESIRLKEEKKIYAQNTIEI